MLQQSKIRAINRSVSFFIATFSSNAQHTWAENVAARKSTHSQKSLYTHIKRCLSEKAVETFARLSQFSDGVVTMLQQRRNSGVLPTRQLFLLKFLWL